MRRLSFTLVLISAVVALGATAAPALAGDLPDSGFLVYKDTLRGPGLVQVRDEATGRVVATVRPERTGVTADPCADPHFDTYSRWRSRPTYLVNPGTFPSYLSASLVRTELVDSQEAWEGRFTTDCPVPEGSNGYDARDGGDTDALPTLVTDLVDDGQNTVAFVSLAGTICDGALACVVADYEKGRIREADLALESDPARYGFDDSWTTSHTTWTDDVGGEYAVTDVATHEFGHFAGLDHVEGSPELTMYPFIHDGDDTLGRGDMLGLLALY